MSYMDIARCNLIRTDTSKSIDEIDETYINWKEEDNDIVEPSEDFFKWDDEFVNDLVKLAKIGVVGEIVTGGEGGENTKYVLGSGIVEEYYGDVVYSDVPNELHTGAKHIAISVLESVTA